MPKVSVIVPVYRVENYIERCARTLFCQTLDDIEYIFIDDCSPDRSMEILKNTLSDYPNRLSQVRFIRMEKNVGTAVVRKVGIEAATGEYYIHCDSDDWIENTMYEKLYCTAVSGQYDMVLSGFYLTDGQEIMSKETYLSAKEELLSQEIVSDRIANYHWNKLIARKMREYIIEWPKDNKCEDGVIIPQVAINCRKIGIVHEALYYYFNQRVDNMSSIFSLDKAKQLINNIQQLESYICSQGFGKKYKSQLTFRKCKCLSYYLNYLSYVDFLKLFPRVLSCYFFSPYLTVKKRLRIISKVLGIK